MTLTLEGPEVVNDYVMQQWFQIVDRAATDDLTESDCETSDYEAGICTYYESLTCSFQYSEKILDENGGVTIANSIIQGYKGVYEMKDSIGAFSDIVILNKTNTYPWFIDYERSSVQLSSTESQESKTQISCAVFRDFVTDWSEIAIKGGEELEAITGYRMYTSDSATSPYAKGNSDKFTMMVLDEATMLASAAASTFLVLSALI